MAKISIRKLKSSSVQGLVKIWSRTGNFVKYKRAVFHKTKQLNVYIYHEPYGRKTSKNALIPSYLTFLSNALAHIITFQNLQGNTPECEGSVMPLA